MIGREYDRETGKGKTRVEGRGERGKGRIEVKEYGRE